MATLRGTIWRFYAYRVSVSNGFWLPVGVLYLQQVRGFGLDDVGFVMGAFSVAMVVAEIPTGYLGDRLGRRASLLLGNAVLVVYMVGFTLMRTPLEYLVLHVVWAFGWAFRSGTADAWLYELLASADEADQFARIRGRASTVQMTCEAGMAIAASVMLVLDWSLPFLANAVVAALGIPLLLTLPRTSGASADAELENDSLGLREAVSVLRVQFGRPDLRWMVVYSALFSGFYQVVREFEQPALDTVGVPVAGFGLVYAVFKLSSAGAASAAGWLQDRVGTRALFAMLIPAFAVMFIGVVAAPVLVLPVLTLNRSLGVLMGPIRNQYVNDRLGDTGRATVLSGASMVLVLTGGLAKLVSGPIAESVGLLRFFAGGGVLVAAVGALLWVTVSPIRSRGEVEDVAARTGAPSD